MTRSEVMEKLLNAIANRTTGFDGEAATAEAYARAYECLARCEAMKRPLTWGTGKALGLDSGTALKENQ